MAASIKQKRPFFGGLALQFIYQIPYLGKTLTQKNKSFTQVMQKKQDRDFFVVYYPIFINSTLRVIQKLVFSKYHKTHNSLQKIDPSYIIISNPKGTHRRNHTHKKVLSIISRICRNKCIQSTHALYLMSKFFLQWTKSSFEWTKHHKKLHQIAVGASLNHGGGKKFTIASSEQLVAGDLW